MCSSSGEVCKKIKQTILQGLQVVDSDHQPLISSKHHTRNSAILQKIGEGLSKPDLLLTHVVHTEQVHLG